MPRLFYPLLFFSIILPHSLFSQVIVKDSTWYYEGYDSHPDWDLTRKIYYNYDGEGRLVLSQTYDAQSYPMENYAKAEHSYNDDGLLSKVDEFRWDTVASDWEISKETFYEYDEAEHITLLEEWEYYFSSISKRRAEFEYNEYGQLTYFSSSSWSPGWGWGTETYSNYTYDNNQNLIFAGSYSSGLSDEWDYTYDNLNRRLTSEYISADSYYGEIYAHTRSIYHYTSEQTLADSLFKESYNTFQMQWLPSQWNYYTYDADGQVLLDFERRWMDTDSTWKDYYQHNYSFDVNGNETEYLREYFNPDSLSWVNQYRRFNLYNDMNLQQEEYTGQSWSLGSTQWVGGWHFLWEYDEGGYLLQEEVKYWNSSIAAYRNSYINQHFWSELTTGTIPAIPTGSPCVFPNPITTGQSIFCEGLDPRHLHTLRIHDFQGRLVHEYPFTGQHPQFLAPIPPGFYVFSIETQGRRAFLGKVRVY